MDLGLTIPDDYKPTENELNNLTYLTCKYTCDWPMRACDLQVCLTLTGGIEAITGNTGISKYVADVCEYLWDHILGEPGEPDDPTTETLFEHIKPLLVKYYEITTREERNCID